MTGIKVDVASIALACLSLAMREDPMFKNILLAVDGTDTAEHAAREGIRLAMRVGAKATILTVTVPWETYFARELAVVVPDAVVPRS